MKTYAIALSAAFLGTTAFAETGVSPGAAMLARTLGVAPGHYTVNELVQLRAALDDDDVEGYRFIARGQTTAERISTSNAPNAGLQQIIRANRISAHGMTPNQVIRFGQAGADEGDRTNDLSALMHEVAKTRPFAREHVSQGEAQLAAALGVDPRAYTLSELVQMSPVSNDD